MMRIILFYFCQNITKLQTLVVAYPTENIKTYIGLYYVVQKKRSCTKF